MIEGEIVKKKITPLELSPRDRKLLFMSALNDSVDTALNSEQLGKYRNSELLTIEATKRLRELGLLEDLKNFQKGLPFQSRDPQIIGEELEKLVRIVLKKIEENKNKI